MFEFETFEEVCDCFAARDSRFQKKLSTFLLESFYRLSVNLNDFKYGYDADLPNFKSNFKEADDAF